MTWEELLDEFRALGGDAENVRLGVGPYGRGIFVIDPQLPARLWAPESMHIRIADIEADDRGMTARHHRYDPRVRTFFENYQALFGWGAGGREESSEKQAAWHALPADVVAAIKATGTLDRGEERFFAPSPELTMREYLCTRQFLHDDGHYLVPVVDLVNHSAVAQPYAERGGYGVEGTFAGEVLVCYSPTDPWTKVLNYGFATTSTVAHSIGATIALPGGRKLSIGRNFLNVTVENNFKFPSMQIDGNEILLSHLVLAFESAKDLPRAIFSKLMERAGVTQPDYVFDSIAHYNRTQFIALLRTLRKYDGPLARMLEEAIINQLEALSACIGARRL